ncbi:MAG: helix-turn-helix transcriptional regulator [Bacilli bacterium]|nr:helix-turn-helix transcriptional regulator [Bacilli bacterium]
MKEKYADLIKLIEKAQGNKTLNQFALASGVNAGHLSRILNGNFKNPPSPDLLKKIANNSRGEVSYEELLKASGYIDDDILKKKEDISIYNKENIEKYNHLIENTRIKLLFDKLGELDDEELDQVADIVNIVTKIDKNKDNEK